MTNIEMQGKVRAFAGEYGMLPAGSSILCALSGGADSMVLLHLLTQLGQQMGFSLCAAHYNHGLRGEESLRDARFVADFCEAHQIPFLLGEGDVAAAAKESGRGIEETAREKRYAFLEDAAVHFGADKIATAHNADDNAETLLLHLLRGTGLRGLTGIPPVRGNLIRPLLTVSRQDIEAYLVRNDLPHVEDSSNADPAYSRNKIRHQVMPLLRELNPSLTETMTASIDSLRQDQSYLTARALEISRQAKPAEDGRVIPTHLLANTPTAVAARVIQQLLEEIEAPMASAVHVRSILAVARGENTAAALHLPGGVFVYRVYGDVLFAWEKDPLPPFQPVALGSEEETCLPGLAWTLIRQRETRCPASPLTQDGGFYFTPAAAAGPLLVRPRQPKDAIQLPGRPTKTLKKLFIEAKVPRQERERIPVLANQQGDILAVAGFGPQRSLLAQPGAPAVYFRWSQTTSTSDQV